MNDSKVINPLFDFSELRRKSDDQNYLTKFSENTAQLTQNQALLNAFKQLRQKLKMQERQINSLKDQIKISNIKNRQNEQALSLSLKNGVQLRDKLQKSISQNQQLKKKLSLMKEAVQTQTNQTQQIIFAKKALLQMKNHADILQQQKNKILEISLQQKMQLEQQILKLKSKVQSDNIYISQIQNNLNKARQDIIKQDNQLKKLSINLDQQIFNKNWVQDNFQTQHLLNIIKDMEKQINSLKSRIKKEKQRKIFLEDRIIQLQQLSGFHNVKAETFEGQIDMITKKYTKIQKKYKDSKAKFEQIQLQKLQIQQSFNKLIFQKDQFVQKLQQANIPQIANILKQFNSKASFTSQKIQKNQNQIKNLALKAINTPIYPYYESTEQNNNRQPLSNFNVNIQKNTEIKKQVYASNITFGGSQNEGEKNTTIDNRIRRQREQMQKKIKEKILHRKLETSTPNEQLKFRSQYIKTFIENKY